MVIPSFGRCVGTGFCTLSIDIPFALHSQQKIQLKCPFSHLKQKREKNRCAKMKSCLSKIIALSEKKELKAREEQG
jgi:hypothetical protein